MYLLICPTAMQVVDNVLKDHSASDPELYNRARGLLLLGAIFKSTVPDESDEERRELERCVPFFFSFFLLYQWNAPFNVVQDGCRSREAEKEAGAAQCRDAGRTDSRARSAPRTRERTHDSWSRVPLSYHCCPRFRLYVLK
jgi:hypothetical protein